MLDQGAYFEGQQRYEFKSLLEESADEAFQHLFVTPLRSLAHSYQHLIITEACLQSSVFEGTQVRTPSLFPSLCPSLCPSICPSFYVNVFFNPHIPTYLRGHAALRAHPHLHVHKAG
ncbi:hypothetical protein B484DRAFT_449703 [Ochromonadaceae sp. CCMP2298]|nr:hypothetical protein B484DRAFT_449703 [Ochromonadaceae sp. CCMP2298]